MELVVVVAGPSRPGKDLRVPSVQDLKTLDMGHLRSESAGHDSHSFCHLALFQQTESALALKAFPPNPSTGNLSNAQMVHRPDWPPHTHCNEDQARLVTLASTVILSDKYLTRPDICSRSVGIPTFLCLSLQQSHFTFERLGSPSDCCAG